MSLARSFEVARQELHFQLRRPLFWIWLALLALMAWQLSTGNMRVSSGDSEVGGDKAWATSQFSIALLLTVLVPLLHAFFISVASGMSVIRDSECGIEQLLHSTRLKPAEYVWGKFAGCLASFLIALAAHLALTAFFNHSFVPAEREKFTGPFELANYLSPAIFLALPTIVFFAGVAFLLGESGRRPILVFFLPVAALLVMAFLLWGEKPAWLDARYEDWLMWVDPGGQRWLQETWLKVDRGVDFYNHASIAYDARFAASRLAFVALGLGSVALSAWHFARALQGARAPAQRGRTRASAALAPRELPEPAPLRTLAMASRRPGWIAQAREIARVELRELRSQPGLYLFVPLILLQVLGMAVLDSGPMGEARMATSGLLAARSMNTLVLLVCLLLLFYAVESLERERATGLAPVHSSTPTRTSALLFGKTVAASAVGLVILLVAFLACCGVLLYFHKAPIELRPFALLWGLLLPSFFLWSAFVVLLRALTGNRYTTYALALAALAFTGYRQMTGKMNWVGNWDLWGAVRWSDFGVLEVDARAMLLNRVFALALGAWFVALAVRVYPRRAADAAHLIERLRPAALVRSGWPYAAAGALPLLIGVLLYRQVQAGFEGDALEQRGKDYWRKNLMTWLDAPQPTIERVELEVELEPRTRGIASKGVLTLANRTEKPLARFALTPGPHWKDTQWTIDGAPASSTDESGLHVLRPAQPLAPGASLALGFSFHGNFPQGVSKNGRGTMEFVLPSGVVLTSFTPSFVPLIGYQEGIGVDEENRAEPKVYADDFYLGRTPSAFGQDVAYPCAIRVTVPEGWRANSVGVLVGERAENGKRSFDWRSDYPVTFFNIVAGRWAEKRGEGTVVYYLPQHEYNLGEISSALEAARRHYSEWFMPFPWSELKLSEFPGLSDYAQGFPTNISFSESIGFLTRSDPTTELAYTVTAHEAAHQWWGNLLSPGKGPGGNILSEGMAHFSTALLMEAEKGERGRIEFLKRIEERYGDERQLDSERALVQVDGNKAGDTTVTYDKGGWVFYMLMLQLGRERGLAGYREFLRRYHHSEDHPVLQDLLVVMREQASDAEAFDAFAQQWFHEVVLPEYEIRTASVEPLPAEEHGADHWLTTATVRNKGTGRMQLEVAVARGERFPKGKDSAPAPRAEPEPAGEPDAVLAADAGEFALAQAPAEPAAGAQSTREAQAKPAEEPYRDARTRIWLGAGEELELKIASDFRPARVLVDPDVHVLQLRRKQAERKL